MAPTRQHQEQVTLDQFLECLPQTVDLFVSATKAAFANGDADMNPERPRPEAWWYRDIAAYLNYLDLEDQGGRR